MEIWKIYGNKARELMNGKATDQGSSRQSALHGSKVLHSGHLRNDHAHNEVTYGNRIRSGSHSPNDILHSSEILYSNCIHGDSHALDFIAARFLTNARVLYSQYAIAEILHNSEISSRMQGFFAAAVFSARFLIAVRFFAAAVDGLGSSAGLMASLAAACNQESPSTLIIYFSTTEASIYTKNYPGVPSTSKRKDSYERRGHLISWKDDHIWIRLPSAEMQEMVSKSNQISFALGLRNIFKHAKQQDAGTSRSGNLLPQQNRTANDIAAVLRYAGAHTNKAREMMNGSAAS